MENPTTIREIADLRLAEAECLQQNGYYEGAFYLAGYAVELYFKAKICECLGVPNFYEKYVTSDLSKVYMVHKLDRLLLLSGLFTQMEAEKIADTQLIQAWSRIINPINGWSEKSRYDKPNQRNELYVQGFINAVKSIILWIRNH